MCTVLLTLLAGCGYVGFELQALEFNDPLDSGGDLSPEQGGKSGVDAPCALGTADHCGACDVSCADANLPNVGAASCAGEVCVPVSCQRGFGDCDGRADNGCEADLTLPEHCGACGHTCQGDNAVMACAAGECVVAACEAGFDDCDGESGNGCERSMASLTDCGGCGVTCAAPSAEVTCSAFECELVGCMPGYGDCDGDPLGTGCETSLSSLTDCGGCGVQCSVTAGVASCSGGICTGAGCVGDFADCDGDSLSCETALTTLEDCGACGATCGNAGRLPRASAACVAGSCVVGACDALYGDCDALGSNGCETPLSTLSDCGACGAACAAPYAVTTCATGTCDIANCLPGFADCSGGVADGCETSLLSVNSCGACGVSCSGGEQCLAGVCVGFSFTPDNFPASQVDPSETASAVFNCGVTRFDSTSLSLSNACGSPAPQVSVVTQAGADLVVLAFRDFAVASGSTFRVVGNRPVALAVLGSATISGTIDVSAEGATAGPGGNDSCATSAGGNGSGSSSAGGGGGGGGGYGTSGGRGGYGDNDGNQGIAGTSRGSATLTPLWGGCGGGSGGGCPGAIRGAGGGAIQISAGDTLRVSGAIRANGSGGPSGCGSEGGGSGGGAGGGILLQADTLVVTGTLQANGGNGGNGRNGGSGGRGGTASLMAEAGQFHYANGGGGGGGAVGRIRLRGHSSCSLSGSSQSPSASLACP